MGNLMQHARKEMALLRGPETEPDEMQDAIDKCVFDIVEIFEEQGHSGSSAPYVISCLEKILRFEPITPLTGSDEEWDDNCRDGILQNNRCSRVFKEVATGETYDIHGRVFVEPDGSAYTSRDSRVAVQFPYRPSTEYVKVGEQN